MSTPFIVGGIPVASIARNSMLNLVNEESDRVLVLIQLNGGNDGLSMLTPLNSYDALANVRSNIILPQNKLLGIDNNLALHTEMTGMKSMYDDAKVNVIQNVGYPEQNRSHFRSTDIWNSGSSANEFLQTGWIGRYLDTQFPGYPSDYPSPEYQDPFALTIGSIVSETCQGFAGNFSMALADPTNVTQLNTPTNNELVSGCGADQLGFLVNEIEKTNEYGDRIKEAYELGNNLSSQYDDENRLSAQLKTVARLISGGLASKFYVVSLGGFDTHANQTEDSDPSVGIHAGLLKTLSDAIAAFQDDVSKLGLEDRVLGMTYSEFGRRIRSNDSYGTDHGDAAPLIVFGNCVNAGVVGTNPEITTDVGGNDGINMETDFRNIYGSVLMDWFDVEESTVKDMFHDEFSYIPIASTCAAPSAVEDIIGSKKLTAYPNPISDVFTIEFETETSYQRISLHDGLGREIQVVSNRKFESASHQLRIDMRSYPSGNYFVRMLGSNGTRSVKVVKI